MRYAVVALLVVLVLVAFAPLAMASTEGEGYPDVSGIQPFSPEANFMSLPGFLRLKAFQADNEWMSRLEAVRAVKAQGADPTLGCWDAMVLNGCRAPL